MNNTKSKKEVISEFIADLEERIDNILKGRETKTDYSVIKEYFELAGVSQKIIEDSYGDCDLDSWEDIYEKRHKKEYRNAVECAKYNIKGIATGVIIKLREYISKIDE